MISIFQLASVLFSLLMIYVALIHYKKKNLNLFEFRLWVLIWIMGIVVIIFPKTFQTIAQEFSFARLFDLVVVVGIMVITALSVVSYVRVGSLRRKFEEWVSAESIKDEK